MKYITPTLYLFFISSLFLVPIYSNAGDSVRISRNDYIATYKEDAVRDMKKTGVPASITLAQALLESDDGNSKLAREANNHFGVKCSNWTGDTFHQDDDHKDECFRKYNSVLESYDDHSNFLRTRPRYASLFDLELTDYKGWAQGLKKAGYATNPAYADRLIKIIEDNSLYELDRGNNLPVQQPIASTNKIEKARKVFFSSVSNEPIHAIGIRHEVLTNNGIPYVVAKNNDDYKSIADEFDINTWQIYKYNEINRNTKIQEGQRIYLKPKKRSGKEDYAVLAEGQTLHDIAQEHGIKMRLLLKWNNFNNESQASIGQKIFLKKQ